jgi:multidrug resistance efflux pump
MKNNKLQSLPSWQAIYYNNEKSPIRRWVLGVGFGFVILLFLPWTQNINSKGTVTTLYQDQRPQELNLPIAGKITKWWVKEGDFVKKGDTILQVSEIKTEYLDPQLIDKTKDQSNAKKLAVDYYQSKIFSIERQILALQNLKDLKTKQLRNKYIQLEEKLNGEKAELTAVENEMGLLKDQYERQEKLYLEGLVSKTQLQQRNISYQNSLAKKTALQNKINQTNQDIQIANIELKSIDQDYSEKIDKANGEKYQSLSMAESTKSDISKLENQVSNYTLRNEMYVLLAPQDGQIIQAKKSGIGEIVKEGEIVSKIVPSITNYAVELFVKPVDFPLVQLGQKVRFQFDGFPAIVFSGWPNASYGTFGGEIKAIESNIGENGMFRILVVHDPKTKKWPEELRVGCGAHAIALLNDVPIWYEIWRNINGFPPDFYKNQRGKKQK